MPDEDGSLLVLRDGEAVGRADAPERETEVVGAAQTLTWMMRETAERAERHQAALAEVHADGAFQRFCEWLGNRVPHFERLLRERWFHAGAVVALQSLAGLLSNLGEGEVDQDGFRQTP